MAEKLRWPSTCCNSSHWSIKLRRDMSSQTDQTCPEVVTRDSATTTTCWPGSATTTPSTSRRLWSKPKHIDRADIKTDIPRCLIGNHEDSEDSDGDSSDHFKPTNLLPDSRKSKIKSRALQRSQSLRLSRVRKVKLLFKLMLNKQFLILFIVYLCCSIQMLFHISKALN